MAYSRSPKSRKRSNYVPIVAVLFALILILAAGGLYATGHAPFARKSPQQVSESRSTGSSATKGESSNGTTSEQSNNQTPGSSKDNGSGSNQELLSPTGNFVSTHKPRSSDQLSSTCATTSGATCQITFTKDGVTKSLPVETTDAGGAAYWGPWKPQDYGLTPGSWTVTATAKLGTQTKTSTDALPLEVTQ